MSYVDQVVKFIESNTGGAQLGATSNDGGFADPFTGMFGARFSDWRFANVYRKGGSRYQPSTNSSAAQSTFSDPFTGSGAYRPGQSSTGSGFEGTDPFTGEYEWKTLRHTT